MTGWGWVSFAVKRFGYRFYLRDSFILKPHEFLFSKHRCRRTTCPWRLWSRMRRCRLVFPREHVCGCDFGGQRCVHAVRSSQGLVCCPGMRDEDPSLKFFTHFKLGKPRNTRMAKQKEVVVVGAGPGGLAVAIQLAVAGARVVVLGRTPRCRP